MKLNADDLQKLEKYETKRGIVYAKTGGNLYKGLLALGFISWLYMMLMVTPYVLGNFLLAGENTHLWNNTFITVFSAFIVTLITPIVFAFGLKLTAFITNIFMVSVLAVVFAKLSAVGSGASSTSTQVTEFDFGIFGLKKLFYWRHGIPMLIVLVTFIWLVVITIRERTIVKRELSTIKNNEYEPQIIE